jgi:hypothetical protein
MPNGIKNATGLDGATDWINGGSAGSAAITTDEAIRGGPGRAVIVSSATSSGAGQSHYVASSQLLFAAGERIEAFAHFAAREAGAAASAYLAARWYDAGGAVISTEPIGAVQTASSPRRGLPATFSFTRARLVPPPLAVRVRLEAHREAIASGATSELQLLKPYLGGVASGAPAPCWIPGPHTNPDLDLDAWPDSLPDFRDLDSPRTPTRSAFSTDAQIPVGRRFATRGRIRFSGELALTLEQRDTLEQFFEARNLLPDSAPFWFVHPDTRQLTRAWFDPEDGDPADSGRGRERRTRVGLLLEIA